LLQLATFGRAMAVFVLFAAFAGLSIALAVELKKLPGLSRHASTVAAHAGEAKAVPVATLPSTSKAVDANQRAEEFPAASPASADSSLASRNLAFPVQGYERALRDTFDESRGSRRHEALDIMAPRGTPVVAVEDGRVAKLFRSAAGGITVYQFDPSGAYAYYYAHLDRYAEGLAEGAGVKRGDVIGYVGSTGNAPAHAPHLHFTIFRLGPERKWWKGEAINPFPYLAQR
jgi:murein DD-endopeptidase MepM/ murein hydrolase activator NlpD